MVPYLILVIVPLLLVLPYTITFNTRSASLTEKRDKRALVFFFSFFLIMLCLKSDYLGADTQQYYYHFSQISSLPWSAIWGYGYEVGFVALYKLISTVTSNFHWAVVVVNLLSVIPIMLIYCSDYKYSYLKIALFISSPLFAGYFSGGRQNIAVGIVLLAYLMVKKKKPLRFLLLVFIASLFHSSAWIALLLYPAYHVRIRKKLLPIIGVLMMVIFVFRRQIFTSLLVIASDKYVNLYGTVTETGAFTLLILYILFSIFIFVVTNVNTRDQETNGLYNYMLIATAIQMFTSIAHGVGRLNMYFIIFIPMLIPKVIECPLPRYRSVVRYANIIMCIFFTVYFFISLTSSTNNITNIYPYKFYW